MSTAVAKKRTAPTVSKTGKVRTNVNGKIAWVYPDELPLANPQHAAAGDIAAAELLDWDGEETAAFAPYEDYLESRPARSEMRPYAEPKFYWAPAFPGAALQPYPRMSALVSSDTGIWTVNNDAQDGAVRSHLRKTCGVDPDELLVTAREWDVMQGKASKPPVRYCHDGGCRWVSCSPLANQIHEESRGHTTHARPRET